MADKCKAMPKECRGRDIALKIMKKSKTAAQVGFRCGEQHYTIRRD